MLSSEGLTLLSEAIRDPLKKKLIAKDETIIGGLVLILSNSDMSVVVEALNILMSLSAPVENRSYLRDFIGMVSQLEILSKDTNPLDHIRESSSKLLTRLNSTEPLVVHQPPKQRNPNVPAASAPKPSKGINKPFLLATKFKTVILQIDGLIDKNDMELCRECLLTVKGVVSITFDLNRHRTIVRVKPDLTVQQLAAAIKATGNLMVAGQINKSELGEETIIPVDTTDLSNDKENSTAALPDYLPEEDSPVKVDDKAIRRFGSKDDNANGSWLGAAASFLAKSFYW